MASVNIRNGSGVFQKIPTIKGDEGLSAYEVWLSLGNLGTEQDYLADIKGEQGLQGRQYNPVGEWVSSGSYENNTTTIDVVGHNGSSYYCKITNSGSTITPDVDTTNWGVLANFGTASGMAIIDSGSYFESANVEGALQEIGLKMNNIITDMENNKFLEIRKGRWI